MRNWKRILAALLALAMLFSMAAISEETPAPEQAGEAVQVEASAEEVVAEEPVQEEAEQEPAEEPVEEPSDGEPEEEPSGDEPVEEEAPEGPVEGIEEAGEPEPEIPEEEPAEAEPEQPIEVEEPFEEDIELRELKVEQCPDGQHNFWDADGDLTDICQICGYQCYHTNMEPVGVELEMNYPELGCVPYNENLHKVYADTYECLECPVCYKREWGELLATKRRCLSEHVWTDPATGEPSEACVYCGYDPQDGQEFIDPSQCSHANKRITRWGLFDADDERLEESNQFAVSVDDKKHRVSGNMTVEYDCPDCDLDWKETGEFNFEEEHFFVDGACEICGHKNTCAHPAYKFLPAFDVSAVVAVDNKDPQYHDLMLYAMQVYCKECGELLWYEYDMPTLREAHDFDDSGVCAVCGYSQNGFSGELCPDGEHDFWDYDTDEPSDTCADCGYKCPHDKGTAIYHDELRKGVEQYDQTYHLIHYDLEEDTACSQCRKTFSTRIVETDLVAKEGHFFYDSTGDVESDICSDCGYNRTNCDHKRTSTRVRVSRSPENPDGDAKYEKIDGKTHKVSGHLIITEECDDCGKCLREDEEGYFEDIIEEHDFYAGEEEGVCDCGFEESDCQHPDCFYADTHGFLNYYIDCKQPDYHYVHYIYATKFCPLCDYYEDIGEYDEKEPHVFKDGSNVCELCGYQKSAIKATKVEIATPAKAQLNIGETLSLEAKQTPQGAASALLWLSSNHAVATVNGRGEVTAVGAGSTNITVKTENGKSSKKLKITVVDPDIPTKLSFGSKKIEKKLGETAQLKDLLTVEPDTAKLTWSSSNYGVVFVDDETGEASMDGIGSAKITVSAATVSGKKAKSASITISVTDPSAPTKITLDQSKITMSDTDSAPVTIKAVLSPNEANSKWGVDWASSNENVAIVDEDGVVTAVGKGKAKITATATMNNNQGKPVRASATVEVKKDSFIPTSMSVSAESLNLTTDDDTADITVTLSPDGEKYGGCTWKNSDEKVVFMSQDPDGMAAQITPQAAGTAKLTVTSKKNKRLKKTITVTVKDPHAITSFRLKQTSPQRLFVGEDLQLEPVFGGPNEESDVSYIPKKNSGIVEIEEETGLITACKPGKVQITATTAKKIGSGKNAKRKSVKLTIQVLDPNTPKEIRINQKDSLTSIAVGQPVQLSCTITTESGATIHDGVKWSVKDSKKALIDDEGKLYALKSGVRIIVTATTDAKGADGKPKKATITLQS